MVARPLVEHQTSIKTAAIHTLPFYIEALHSLKFHPNQTTGPCLSNIPRENGGFLIWNGPTTYATGKNLEQDSFPARKYAESLPPTIHTCNRMEPWAITHTYRTLVFGRQGER